MFIAATEHLSGYDMGAVVLIFIIAAGLLRLLGFVIKERFTEKQNKPCNAFKNNSCPLAEIFQDIKKKIDGIYAFYEKRSPCISKETLSKIEEISEFIKSLK